MATINYCNYEIKGTLSTTGTITSGGIITAPGGNSSQWNTGYANSITGFSDSGSSTITLTLTQQDGGTLTTSFSNPQGTVKSVGISHAGNAFNTGSAVTTNGTLAITMAGNSTQYVNGAGDLVGFPSIPQGDITGVIAGTGMSGGGLSGTVTLNCLITNNNQLTNGAGYTTDTGTTTPSNTQTFTNKSGNISQWTNDDGYTTNTGTMSGFGVAAAIGGSTFTITNGQTLSLVGGTNITAVFNSSNESITFNNDITSNSQLTNGAGYITAGSLQGVPAILSNGSVPSLNTGISAAEVRTLIGAGTTSSTGTVTSVTVQGNTGLSGSGTVTTSGSITLTNADRGSSQNIFKNVAVSGQSTVVADTNNDTLTFVGAGGMTITTDASSDTITFNPNDDNTNNFVTGGSISGATLSLTRSGLSTLSISGIPTNNNQLTNGAGYITSASLPSVSNAVISVTTAAGLDGASSFTLNGGAATVALSLDLNELAVGGTLVATDSLVAVNGGINNKQLISSIPLSIFNNNAGFITSASLPTVNNPTVTFSAGSGLSGGGSITMNQSNSETITFNGFTNNNQLTNGAGYITISSVGIINSGGSPTLGSGITAAEVRSLIGAGTSSSSGVTSVGGSTTIASSGGTSPSISANTSAVNLGSSVLATGAQIQTAINTALTGVLQFEGTWNASTNSPALASGVGTSGDYYIVSTPGSTNLDGITDWVIGDWAVFANTTWTKIDNSQVGNVTGSGSSGRVAFWNGNENITSDAGLTFNGGSNALTATGLITASGGNSSQWNSGYANAPTGFGNSGSATKTLTISQQDGSTLTTSFSIPQGTVTTSGVINANEFPQFIAGSVIQALTAGEMRTALNVPNTTTVITNNNQLTNGAGYTGNTGTTTASNSQTFTNKGGNISQWTNNSGYITAASLQGVPAILSNGSAPSLNSGISAAEVRSLIGAGTSSSAGVTSVATSTGLSGGTITSTGTITNTDRGSQQSIFKNFAVSGQSTVVADNNNDTVTLVATGGMSITTNASTDTITFNPNDDNDNYYVTSGSVSGGTVTLNRQGLSAVTFAINNNQITNGAGYITAGSLPSVGNGQIDGRTSGNGLSGSMDATANQSGNTTFTVASNATTSAVGSTIVYRDSSADINVRLLRANYPNDSSISGGIAFRNNNTTDNYTRYCSSPSAIRAFIGAASSSVVTGVTSVAQTHGGNAFTVGGSPVTSSGTLAITMAGSSNQYINGAGNLTTFPSIPQGDITAVNAGTNMSGGGSSGSVTLNCTISNNNQLSNGSGYITIGSVAITSNGSTPSLGSGISAAEVRSLIGAGTSSSSGVTSIATSSPILGGTITGSGTISHANSGVTANTYSAATITVNSTGHVTSASSNTIPTNNNQLTNGASYTTSGSNISQFSNNSGYITASSTNTLTNKGGNISQWSNNSGYVTSSGNTTIGTSTNISTPGSTVISTISLTQGVVTAFTTRTLTLANLGYTGATNANNITNNNQLTNGAGYITSAGNQGTVTSIATTNGITGGTITGSGTIQVDSTVIRTTGTQTLGGNKTFTNDIIVGAGSSVILNDQPTASTSTGNGFVVNWSVSVSVTAGTAYVVKTDGGWTTTDADSEAKSTAMAGIALGSNATAGMLLQGFFYKASHGFNIGEPLFISNTAGALTNTRPSGNNDYVRIMGYATSTNYIYFDPDKTWVKVTT